VAEPKLLILKNKKSYKPQAPSTKPQAAATFCRASLYSLTQIATF